MEFEKAKIETYIPETHLKALQKALQDVDAGHVGNYDSCMSVSRVTGFWRPLEGSAPFMGSTNEISQEEELKIEVVIQAKDMEKTISAIRKVHPYEEPVINVIPLL